MLEPLSDEFLTEVEQIKHKQTSLPMISSRELKEAGIN